MVRPDDLPPTPELRQRCSREEVENLLKPNPPLRPRRRDCLDRLIAPLFGRDYTLMDRLRIVLTGRAKADDRYTAMIAAVIDREWEDFTSRYRQGDEVWHFSNGQDQWDALAGRAGYALVRNGEVVAALTVIEN